MTRVRLLLLVAGLLTIGLWLGLPASSRAEDYTMDRFFYYPYYYFPHSYWPINTHVWPERPGEPYRAPPAYMAYPPFKETHWNYPLFERMTYYRGFHFWLDAF
jgi:hypothetical protein